MTQFAETFVSPAQPVAGGRTMKFTFPPESRPLDGYTLKRGIHRGGFGEVYYAVSDAGKEVALKLLRDNTDVEVRGISQCMNLKHPNLVTIFDIRNDADGDYWIVMEYVSGKTLDSVVGDHPHGMPIEEVKRWFAGIAQGLAFLHDRGIVHRDLKPANIYNDGGTVKIGDVGLAKYISESRRNAQTESVGTVYYMAPEVAHGRYGREVDIYSLGILLYEMLTGRVPFDGESTAEILMKHLSERPDLSPLPKPFRAVIARALEKDPLKRTPTVAELERDFNLAASGKDVPMEIPADSFVSRPPPLPQSPSRQQTPADRIYGAYAQVHSARRGLRYLKKAEKEWRKHRKEEAKLAYKQMKHEARLRAAERQYGRCDGTQFTAAHSQPRGQQKTDWTSHLHLWLRVLAVAIVLLAIFRPGMLPGLMRGLFVGGCFAALSYGLFRLIGFLANPGGSRSYGGFAQPAVAAASPVYEPAGVGVATLDQRSVPRHEPPPQPVHRQVGYTPETPRSISLRRRMAELTGSMTSAVVCTAIITAGLALFTSFFSSPLQAGLFGLTTLLASWAVLAFSKTTEGQGEESGNRRLVMLALGAGVGFAAAWLQAGLMAQVPDGGLLPPIFERVGQLDLIGSASQPTVPAYMVFFAGLFALRRWWVHADGFRYKRFRLGTVLLTLLVAYLMTTVWAFPQVWGLTLAVAISSVVQLASVWVPPQERPREMMGEYDV